MQQQRSRHATFSAVANRMVFCLVIAFALSLVVTWSDTGSPFGEGFASRFVQLAMLGAVVAAQKIGLLTAIVVGIVLAFAAVWLYEGDMSSYYWLGNFFLFSLKMIIVPLVVFAMISGITGMGDVRKLGRLGGRTVLYYLITTTLAVILGSVLVNLIQPGAGMNLAGAEAGSLSDKAGKEFSDLVMGFVSGNIFESMAKLEMLPIIVFSLVFGAALTTVGEMGKPLIAVCNAGNEVMMKIVHWIMVLAPVGIFGLVAGRFGTELAANGTEAFFDELRKVASYSWTVVGGLGVHALVVLPLILYLTTGRGPMSYARGMASALLTAFSTASSSATMPMTLEAVEENNGVDPRASQFVIPLGATVNMDGTALYEAVAVIFIAQATNIDLDFGQQVLIVLTATFAAIGAAGIPQAGLVTMIIVLQAVGMGIDGIQYILAVDWLLDRFRTTVNVWGDAVGAAVLERHGLGIVNTGPASGSGPDSGSGSGSGPGSGPGSDSDSGPGSDSDSGSGSDSSAA